MTPKGPVDTTAERIADDIDSHTNSVRLLLTWRGAAQQALPTH